jgi:hypothetical protein
MLKKIIIALGIIFIAIQFYPISRENPPFEFEMAIKDDRVYEILRNSCYDCHSYETNWPWYSYVAPISWLISDDVNEGRKEFNFNEYVSYSPKKKLRKLEEIKDQVSEGEMPLDKYLWTHPSANLSEDDRTALYKWLSIELDKIPIAEVGESEREREEREFEKQSVGKKK